MKKSGSRLSRARRATVVGRTGTAVVAVLAATTLHSSAAEDPNYPGLPDHGGQAAWIAPQAAALTYTNAAKQWVRTPHIQLIASSQQARTLRDPSCRRLRPFQATTEYGVEAYFASPPGSPQPYGYAGPFTTRTVAFGTIPVEAKVRLRQPRDSEGLPLGLTASEMAAEYCPGLGPHAGPTDVEKAAYDTKASGPVQAEVTSLVVDGVDVKLTGTCRTATTTLSVTAPDVTDMTPFAPGEDPYQAENRQTTPYFIFTNGGLLTGELDLPPFAGCRTADGDDLSSLLTSAVSGPGNRVEIRSMALAGTAVDDPDACWRTASCPPLVHIDVPTQPPAP